MHKPKFCINWTLNNFPVNLICVSRLIETVSCNLFPIVSYANLCLLSVAIIDFQLKQKNTHFFKDHPMIIHKIFNIIPQSSFLINKGYPIQPIKLHYWALAAMMNFGSVTKNYKFRWSSPQEHFYKVCFNVREDANVWPRWQIQSNDKCSCYFEPDELNLDICS